MYGLQIPQFGGMYYLKVIPGPSMPENLINSVKSNLGSFRSSGLRYSIESYYYKHKNVVNLQRFIVSSRQEGLSYSMNFFQKLYGGRVNFSISVPQKFIQRGKYPYGFKIGLSHHGVLRTKRVGAVGGDDFASSSSILASIFQEIEPFIPENGIIKSTFSFTKGSYSLLVKERLFRKHTKGMDDEDRKMFLASFPDGTELFQFRWDIEHNIQSSRIQPIIEKNLSLYSSYLNGYELMKKTNIFSVIPARKRLMGAEGLLSHGLYIPVSTYGPVRLEPVIIPDQDIYSAGFIVP